MQYYLVGRWYQQNRTISQLTSMCVSRMGLFLLITSTTRFFFYFFPVSKPWLCCYYEWRRMYLACTNENHNALSTCSSYCHPLGWLCIERRRIELSFTVQNASFFLLAMDAICVSAQLISFREMPGRQNIIRLMIRQEPFISYIFNLYIFTCTFIIS